MSEFVTIVDDALAATRSGSPSTTRACPSCRPRSSRRGRRATGDRLVLGGEDRLDQHGPCPAGAQPVRADAARTSRWLPGESTLDGLIGCVERGVYVTRFHYVNIEDPVPVTLTGMTRDGTFLIENGQLTRPLKNLRFTQSAVEALYWCEGVTAERRFVGPRRARPRARDPAAAGSRSPADGVADHAPPRRDGLAVRTRNRAPPSFFVGARFILAFRGGGAPRGADGLHRLARSDPP